MGSSGSTVLITGASSGIGKATALLFQQRDWNVAATMRTPAKATDLQGLERLQCVSLDVTDPQSIEAAIAETLQHFGGLDVVVNNAGYAVMGPFEPSTRSQIQQQFETNVFGVMSVIQAVLPHFRGQKSGVIVNVASVGGRVTFPLYSLYHSTKWAVEGFSESLHYELAPLGIQMKIVEPGPIKTDFYERSADRPLQLDADYQSFYERVMPRMDRSGQSGEPPERVAETIFQAATDRSSRLRYAPDRQAKFLLLLRKVLPDGMFQRFIHQALIR